jgi:hypothetical protein
MNTVFRRSATASRTGSGAVWLRAALLLLLPALVSGCLQMERVVQVNRDGSGVLIERLVLSSEVAAMMTGMQAEGQPLDIRDDEKLRANAASFGDSVRLASVRDLITDFGRGYEARYAFDDINVLRVGQSIEDNIPAGPAAPDGSAGEQSKFTTFTMLRTSPAKLVIHWPVDEAEPDAAGGASASDAPDTAGSPEQEQMAMEMMKMAFRDMRVAMHVEVTGDIVETSATHVEGRRITLMDVDFGALLSDEAALRAMVGDKPATVADMKQLLELVPGLKIEVEPEVAILFR